MSSRNIPQIAVVLGLSTAGGGYVPAMSGKKNPFVHPRAYLSFILIFDPLIFSFFQRR